MKHIFTLFELLTTLCCSESSFLPTDSCYYFTVNFSGYPSLVLHPGTRLAISRPLNLLYQLSNAILRPCSFSDTSTRLRHL